MVSTNYNFIVDTRWINNNFTRICSSTIHLYNFLEFRMFILGISAYYHDSAACLLKDGEIIAAAQEERFTRKKHDARFPKNAIQYCLEEAGISSNQIDNVVFYEKPFVKFERLLETYLAFAPKGFTSFVKAMPVWIKDKLFQKSALIKELKLTIDESVNWRELIIFRASLISCSQCLLSFTI